MSEFKIEDIEVGDLIIWKPLLGVTGSQDPPWLVLDVDKIESSYIEDHEGFRHQVAPYLSVKILVGMHRCFEIIDSEDLDDIQEIVKGNQ